MRDRTLLAAWHCASTAGFIRPKVLSIWTSTLPILQQQISTTLATLVRLVALLTPSHLAANALTVCIHLLAILCADTLPINQGSVVGGFYTLALFILGAAWNFLVALTIWQDFIFWTLASPVHQIKSLLTAITLVFVSSHTCWTMADSTFLTLTIIVHGFVNWTLAISIDQVCFSILALMAFSGTPSTLLTPSHQAVRTISKKVEGFVGFWAVTLSIF